jgi:hypothetical protein
MTLLRPLETDARMNSANSTAAEIFRDAAEIKRQLSLAPRHSEDIARLTELAIHLSRANRTLQNLLDLVAAEMRRHESPGVAERKASA